MKEEIEMLYRKGHISMEEVAHALQIGMISISDYVEIIQSHSLREEPRSSKPGVSVRI
jgi:hypothetical protein